MSIMKTQIKKLSLFSLIIMILSFNIADSYAEMNYNEMDEVTCYDVIELKGTFPKYFCLDCIQRRVKSWSDDSKCTKK